MLLRTFGMPALVTGEQGEALPVRRKDLALLVFLRLEARREHSRSALATLLWSENDEGKARHSLSQSLGRLLELVGHDAMELTRDAVAWRGDLPCDATHLDRLDPPPGDVELRFYTGDFVAGLSLGSGAEGFDEWADGRRAYFRRRATQLLDARGEDAERQGRMADALQLAQRLLEIEPAAEAAHRRVMRSFAALGERALAIRHFQDHLRAVERDGGLPPDPSTRDLAERIARELGIDTAGLSAAVVGRRPHGVLL